MLKILLKGLLNAWIYFKNTIYNLKKNGFKHPDKNKRDTLFSEEEKEAIIEAVDQNRNLTAA